MRDLATEAGVSFVTPFNQFGSKAGIMHALSGRRIETMATRYAGTVPMPDLVKRVRLAVETAVAVMLEEPDVNRAVMGWIGTAGPTCGDALTRSTAYWTLAMGAGYDFSEPHRAHAASKLPRRLALAFRGSLSFWTAGELPDDMLGAAALDLAEAMLLPLVER